MVDHYTLEMDAKTWFFVGAPKWHLDLETDIFQKVSADISATRDENNVEW